MAISSSLSTQRLGTVSASSLVKSALTLTNELNTYNDTMQRVKFENDPTEANLQEYLSYLNGRIGVLQSTGSITNATKAVDLVQTMHSAVSKATSFQIQNESIQVLSGNGTDTSKLNYIGSAYQRAVAIGDMTLAQSLESQYYSLSQKIQYDAQQSASAAKTLATANATAQGDIVSTLTESLKQLNNDIKNTGELGFNAVTAKWVDANRTALQSLGVVIPQGAQPNYFDLVNAVMGAQYNHDMLAAQYAAPYDPYSAANYQAKAQNLLSGASTVHTLAGDLTAQEIQQASQDPSMLAYDYSTGTYKKTAQTGYQYINGQVAPTYSGNLKQVVFINPNQVSLMQQLGLNFNINTMGANKGEASNGVQVQLTDNSPEWLKSVLGKNGITNFYTDQNGNLVFKGQGTNGNMAYYSLSGSANGTSGIFEHLPNGQLQLVGADAGFDPGAASLLINKGTEQQMQIQLASDFNASKSISIAPTKLPSLNFATPKPQPTISMAPPVRTVSVASKTVNPQRTANPQGNNVNPQSSGGGLTLQGGINGFNLNTSGGGGIRLSL